jgi:hypothetical protein
MDAVTMDAPRVRGWLQAMRMQGEDRIWRGADEALRYVDALELSREAARNALAELADAVQMEADGEMGIGGALVSALKDARTVLGWEE